VNGTWCVMNPIMIPDPAIKKFVAQLRRVSVVKRAVWCVTNDRITKKTRGMIRQQSV